MTRLFHLLPTTMPVAKPNDAFALFERHQPAIFHRDATAAAVVPLLPLQSGELNVFWTISTVFVHESVCGEIYEELQLDNVKRNTILYENNRKINYFYEFLWLQNMFMGCMVSAVRL